jgi:hypothetical protein
VSSVSSTVLPFPSAISLRSSWVTFLPMTLVGVHATARQTHGVLH